MTAENSVGKPGNCILFHDGGWNIFPGGDGDEGAGDVTAGTDDEIGFFFVENFSGFSGDAGECEDIFDFSDEGCAFEEVEVEQDESVSSFLNPVGFVSVSRADESDFEIGLKRFHGIGDGDGGEDVAAGTAGSEENFVNSGHNINCEEKPTCDIIAEGSDFKGADGADAPQAEPRSIITPWGFVAKFWVFVIVGLGSAGVFIMMRFRM